MRSLKCTCFVIFVAVCVTDLIDHYFDTLKIIAPAKTGPAGPLPTAMLCVMAATHYRYRPQCACTLADWWSFSAEIDQESYSS